MSSAPKEAMAARPPIRVKVVYFQMPQIAEDQREYVVLQSPANFGELLNQITRAHPSLTGVAPDMVILVNGSAAKTDMQLKDGDEVDFIPAFAGG